MTFAADKLKLPNDIESCHKIILAQQELIEKLVQQVKQVEGLAARVKELEAQLNQTSSNSHRPPSSDGPKKKPAFPRSKGKKRGGQKGHKGKTLEMVAMADHYLVHDPLQRCSCGQDLSRVLKSDKEQRQVFDIPEPKLEVTQHIVRSCTCPNCKREVSGIFPADVRARVQYGPGVKALTVLLNTAYKVPYAKVKRFFADVFGYELNEGTQLTAQQQCHQLLAQTERVLKEKLLASPVVHFDETGLRIEGGNSWLHSCSNTLYTYLFAHPNRGKKAINSEYSLLPQYKGWAIHDCWRSYFLFTQCRHGVCGAHLLRELQALIEQKSSWADRMRDLLLYAYHRSVKGSSKVKDFSFISRQYDRICKMADEQEPPPLYRHKNKRPKQTKGRNLLDRFVNYKEAVLAFAKHEVVPFTNNQAERDVRPAKIKQKIAGSFRTFQGAHRYARIQSFISSLRKNQLNVFNELRATFNGYNSFTAPEGAK